MNFFRHRLTGLPAWTLLLAAVGCSAADGGVPVAVPSPGAKATELCRDLDEALPRKLDGLAREETEPRSALTAAWGSSAIILRCGVERPAEMLDPAASTTEVNGVAWLAREQDDGGYVFTTGLRQAYVEVRFSAEQAAKGAGPLVDFAEPVKETIPEGIAD
ncbi:DUF3515 domain-containing protein [Streptomyces sp. CRN 30]|uniref:DUF3515 domain-containing protein n=1 Tax=Streptomyces sp. CRN 30 TaxID=3075613 RepID=UPI002A7F6C33|nr:DUF3515 domain-containing protein [Streptomyces sp. CRN 30]